MSSFHVWRRRALSIVGVAAAIAIAVCIPAGAAVVHGSGFQARVDGDPGWFGSFRLQGIGPVWCLDAQLPAPQDHFVYKPTDLPGTPATAKAALAWLTGAHGWTSSPIDHAAIALAVHDLVGATYPSGPLRLHRLPVSALSGFGSAAPTVLAKARAWAADARAHQHLRGPYRLTVQAHPTAPGALGRATVRLTDGLGRAVTGVAVLVAVRSGTADGPTVVTTGADGTAVVSFHAGTGTTSIEAYTGAPDLALRSFAPGRRGQRVVTAAQVPLRATHRVATPPTGSATIAKLDGVTGEPVAGAHLALARDADGDGAYESALPTVITAVPPLERRGLVPGRYRLVEVQAPDGYVLSRQPVDFEVRSGHRISVTLDNMPAPVTVTASKVDAVSGRALGGAVYDLYRRLPVGPGDHDDAGEDGAPAVPADAAKIDGHRWTGRARSAADGRLSWPGVRPGAVMCAREVTPPPGYRTDPTLRCTATPVRPATTPHLRLPDQPVRQVTTTTTTTSTTSTTSTPATTTPASSTTTSSTTSSPARTDSTTTTAPIPATAPPGTAGPTPETAAPPLSATPLARTGAPGPRVPLLAVGLVLLGSGLAVAGRLRRP